MTVPRFLNQFLAASALLTCAWGWSLGQEAQSIRSPEDAVRILQGSKTEEQTRFAKRLHLDGDLTGREFEVRHRQLEKGYRTAVITSDVMQDFVVIVLKHTKQTWMYADSLHFSSTYDRLSFDLKPLTEPPLSDIVIHQHVTGHGTGFYEGHFLVVKLIDGKLRVVLDAIEQGEIAGWPRNEGDIEQKSVFKLHPASREQEASVEEEETLSTKLFTEVRERDFEWDPEFRVFEPSQWDSAQKKKTDK